MSVATLLETSIVIGGKVWQGWRERARSLDRHGRELPSEITIWTGGFGVPDLATRSELSTDAVGRLLTDVALTSIDDERNVAA